MFLKIETAFIPQNIVLPNAKVTVYDQNNNEVCKCGIDNLSLPEDLGSKLYSVGIISDAHVYDNDLYELDSTKYASETTYKQKNEGREGDWTAIIPDRIAPADLERAIKFFKEHDMTFVCCCGDLTSYGTIYSLAKYKEIVDANRGEMPVYSIAGNHEYWGVPYGAGSPPITHAVLKEYTDLELFDVVEYGDDVYLFASPVAIESEFGEVAVTYNDGTTKTFNKYNWLVEQFAKYKGKRIFLFMHGFIKGVGVNKADESIYCGDSTGLISTVDMIGSNTSKFINLLKDNPNVIYFHGHSHTMLEMQTYTQTLDPKRPANYDFECGVHSIHIPSVTMPRDISAGERIEKGAKSEGYIMDVYEKYIVLYGIDFIANEYKGRYIPIATYCLKTS